MNRSNTQYLRMYTSNLQNTRMNIYIMFEYLYLTHAIFTQHFHAYVF